MSTSIPYDPLGAFCRDNHIAVPPTGQGSLTGCTFAAKDVFDIAGAGTGFGNPAWLASHPPATSTASAVTRLLAAGADLLGKTLTDELTYSLTGENAHYGTPLNSAAPDRVPGGSSNGSASAVAGRLVDFALGTDCGGSVRIPASYCGLFGIRTTHGSLALDGVIPFAPSFDVIGWFARDGALFERVGAELLAAPTATVLPRRLRYLTEAFAMVTPAVAHAVRTAAGAIEAVVGSTFYRADELAVCPAGLRSWFDVFRVVQGAEIWAQRRDWIAQVKPSIGAAVGERIEWASKISAVDADAARAEHARIRTYLRTLIGNDEVWCLPTSPRVAPLRSAPTDVVENEYRAQAMCLLCIAGLGGLPQVSLPLANEEGLPLGVSLIGAPGSDMQLLALARLIHSSAESIGQQR